MKATAKRIETHTVSAAEFKAKCLQLIDDVNDGSKEFIVTKRGVPKARLVPFKTPEEPAFVSLIGRSPNVRILGDIMTPLYWPDPVDKWNRVMKQGPKKKKRN